MEMCSGKVFEGMAGDYETAVDEKLQNMLSILQMMMENDGQCREERKQREEAE